jgi:stage II sporulation protein D
MKWRIAILGLVAAFVVPAAARAGTVFLLDGRGWGHGVGLSQWGAEGYARHGSSYRAILAHYYPHTSLATVPSRDVRVLLAEGQDRVRIGSAAPFVVLDAKGHELHLPARAVVVDRRFVLRHRTLVPPLRFEAGAQPLTFDLAGYRGDIVVQAKPDGLMAVNELSLDRYLRGVVPAELPVGWHEAAYEAQAVAARTYALATLAPGADFDLYRDDRSQMYGGIRAERPETNLAVGATAGQVLEYDGRPIVAYYSSDSGGRTSAVHDAFPKVAPEPYLVSVSDPYDYISPHHVWPTQILTPSLLGATLGLDDVRDVRVVLNGSGRASAVRVLAGSRWRTFAAAKVRTKFHLGSTDFSIAAMSLDEPDGAALFGAHVAVTGWVRGLGGARLQERTAAGWSTLARVHPTAGGRFRVSVPAERSTELRLAYNGLPGDSVALEVEPRLTVKTLGRRLRVRVAPALPLRVERLTQESWRPVVASTGSFFGTLRPGSYRVAVLGSPSYVPALSPPVGLR